MIVCTGFRFDASIFDPECRPELVFNDRFPAQTPEWESVNVPDLYFAGTLMQVRDFKKSTSGFIHGFRYGVRALHRMLDWKYHHVPLPHRRLPMAPAALMKAVIARVNRTSALWQLFGFLADVVVVDRAEPSARYYEELPLDYVQQSELTAASSCFTVSLEYGPNHDQHDPFDVRVGRIGQGDVYRTGESRYLHPVVRHYRRGVLAAEHHVTDNLENEWTGAVHREPLRAFFERELAISAATVVNG